MRKSKALIEKAMQQYLEGIAELFPESVVEVSRDAYGGFDVWVRILAPTSVLESDAESDLRSAKAALSIRIADETGINIMSTLEDKHVAVPWSAVEGTK